MVTCMDRADATTLAGLEPSLTSLRAMPGIRETSAGTFHRTDLISRFWSMFHKRNEFIHFHQADEPVVDHRCHVLGRVFADLRPNVRGTFQRFPVDTPEQRDALIVETSSALRGA
jgi:hypothetical protein